MEGTLGEIRLFGGISNGGAFVPRGWMSCDGTILNINQNIALFSLLATTYGGDGVTTFALPDLRGRLPVGTGAAPELPAYNLGQKAGREQVEVFPTSVTTDDLVGPDMNSVVPGSASNVQPVIGLNYIICVQGAFPFPPQ